MLLFGVTTENKIGLAVVSGAFIVFALVTSMVIPRFRPDFPGRGGGVRLYTVVTLIFFLGTLAAVEGFAKEEPEKAEAAATSEGGVAARSSTPTATTSGAAASSTDLAAGKKVFESAGCKGCHTLKDAGATGNVGPNLDQLKPNEPTVEHQVINGGGAMPPFKGQLSPKQIKAVSEYVASVAGKG